MNKFTKDSVIDEIKSLQVYEGYIQWSHKAIDKQKDIFVNGKEIVVDDEDGFIYEAHFSNGKISVNIKQIDSDFYLSKRDISDMKSEDMQSYLTDIDDFNYKAKMVQIWEEEIDPYCENMKVKKLKKVVFAGFEKGDTQ